VGCVVVWLAHWTSDQCYGVRLLFALRSQSWTHVLCHTEIRSFGSPHASGFPPGTSVSSPGKIAKKSSDQW
jgi:hypothetical protein